MCGRQDTQNSCDHHALFAGIACNTQNSNSRGVLGTRSPHENKEQALFRGHSKGMAIAAMKRSKLG